MRSAGSAAAVVTAHAEAGALCVTALACTAAGTGVTSVDPGAGTA
jgi:hypothetical protein